MERHTTGSGRNEPKNPCGKERMASQRRGRASCSLSEDAVQQFVRQRLSAFKALAVVEFHEALPREDSGKLFKRKLRDPHWKDARRNI